MLTSVAALKRYSVSCEDGMLVSDEQRKVVTELSVPNNFQCTYCTCNGLLGFFDEKGKLYVAKWSSDAHGVMENNHYKRAYFHIPFSDGKIPFDAKLSKRCKTLLK